MVAEAAAAQPQEVLVVVVAAKKIAIHLVTRIELIE